MNDENNTTPQAPARSTSSAQSMGVPIAIVIAGLIIAGAVYVNGANTAKQAINVQEGINSANQPQQTPEITVAPVTAEDHIRGNPNAPILIVEYSDYDCPFCKNFHETMNRIMDEYGKNGQVAWVYRQFPLEQLHPNAPKISAAAYCVSELGGNEAFWKFSDSVFGNREINAQTDINKLPEYAAQAGVDRSKFELCLKNGTYTEKVKADVEAAFDTGARGTPYSIVMVGEEQGVINGAQPYETVKQIVGNLLSQINGGGVPPTTP